MKRGRVFPALLLFATAAGAAPNLVGEWKSDAVLTMEFNLKNTKLEEKTARFLSQIMGHLTMTFSEGTVSLKYAGHPNTDGRGQDQQVGGFLGNPFLSSARDHRKHGGGEID